VVTGPSDERWFGGNRYYLYSEESRHSAPKEVVKLKRTGYLVRVVKRNSDSWLIYTNPPFGGKMSQYAG
jgi:hypothetical protein